jgi:hypothetical protein
VKKTGTLWMVAALNVVGQTGAGRQGAPSKTTPLRRPRARTAAGTLPPAPTTKKIGPTTARKAVRTTAAATRTMGARMTTTLMTAPARTMTSTINFG